MGRGRRTSLTKGIRVAQLKRCKRWVVLGIPCRDWRWARPYDTKEDAEDDCRAIAGYFRREPRGGDVTSTAALDRLVADLHTGIEHLTSDSVDWFKERVAYLIHCAEHRQDYSE